MNASSVPAPDEYPCDVPVKAMGLAAPDFSVLVMGIVRRHIVELAERDVTTRPSANGKYISVTMNIRAQSRAQLEAIYQDLKNDTRVLMVL